MAAENKLDFLIAAHIQGMEQLSGLINRVSALEKETQRLKTANTGLAASTDAVVKNGTRYNNMLDAQSKALRQHRQGTQQLGMQVNDFFTSVSTGASPMQAFAQQLGQAGYAMSMMGGVTGRVGSLLAGPWGAAVLAGTVLLGLFSNKTKEAEENSVTFGDYARAAIDSVSERLSNGLAPAVEAMGPVLGHFSSLWDAVLGAAKAVVQGIVTLINVAIGAIIGMINAAAIILRNGLGMIAEIGLNIYNWFAGVVNNILKGIEDTVNRMIPVINSLFEAMGSNFRLHAVQLGRMEVATNKWAGTTVKALGDAKDAFLTGFRTEVINIDDIMGRVKPTGGKKKDGAGKGAAGAAKKINDELNKEESAFLKRQFGIYKWFEAKRKESAKNLDAELTRIEENGNARRTDNLEIMYAQVTDIGKRVADEVDRPLAELERSFESIGNTVSDAFKGMLTGAMSWKDGMRGIINAVIDELWRLYVVQNIVGMVTKFLGGTVGGSMVSGVSAGAKSLAGMFPGNANGTPSWRGGMTWVGERGPELINVPRGANIIPAHRAQNMAGNGMTINVDARGSADPAAVRKQVEQGIIQAAPAIIAAAEARTVAGLRRPKLGGVMQ